MRKSALFVFGLVVTIIVALGLVILSSASEANALRLHGDAYYFMKRQFLYLAIGVVLAVGVALFDYRKWRDYPLLTIVFALVVFAALWGVFAFDPVKGSYRWLSLGPIRLQPSEFAKLVTVILLAVWMDRMGWKVETFRRGALFPSVILGVMTVPVVLEPDFGSTVVMAGAGFLIIYVGGARFWHLIPIFLAGLGGVAVKVMSNANRMARIAAWLGVKIQVGAQIADAAAERAAYQSYNALVAIKNGGIWGAGLNQSMQKHYYLPEAHTDFIFAIGAEELGLFFSVSVILLFFAFFILSVYIARKASDRFGRYLVLGMMFLIFVQAMANLGVVCQALPTKGVALPFFSYGGTNMMSAFFAVGTILSVGIHSYRDVKRQFVSRVLMRSRNGRGR